jgi:hypothetical protein
VLVVEHVDADAQRILHPEKPNFTRLVLRSRPNSPAVLVKHGDFIASDAVDHADSCIDVVPVHTNGAPTSEDGRRDELELGRTGI